MGLARDGGLLLPATIPDVSERLSAWRSLDYRDLAFEIMRLYTDLPEQVLRSLLARSYAAFRHSEVTPLRRLDDLFILELFHGPTLAFKDVALQFLGNLFEYILDDLDREMDILAATSGDTGSAAIHGVRGQDRIRIFVMHPHGRVSRTQELQMTSVLDGNVFNMAVEGTFDDCQRIMKTIFRDLEFKDRHSLGSVNSINWARLLAQIVYYFYAAFRAMDETGAEHVRFSVPTGNFGDIFAGWVAARMGLPVSKLVLATNENDILSRFFNTGDYGLGNVFSTISPSMDIQVASNFERYLYYRTGEDAACLRALMQDFEEHGSLSVKPSEDGVVDALFSAGAADRQATLGTIRDFYERQQYVLDPHTAVGVHVGQQHMREGEPLICLATAHASKFADAVIDATGRDVAHHPVIDALSGKETRCEVLPPCVDTVRKYMEAKIGGDDH